MSGGSQPVFWPRIPSPRPIDERRRVVTDETGHPVTRTSDPRVRWWEQRWTCPRGRQRRRRFEEYREAERLHDELRAAKRDGWPACPETGAPLSPAEQRRREEANAPTFARVLEQFLDDQRPSWQPKTFQTYEPPLRLAARWLAEAHQGRSPLISEISRRQVRTLIDRRRRTRLQPAATGAPDQQSAAPGGAAVGDATVKNFRKALGFLFHWALDEELISASPMPAMKLRSQDPPKRHTVPTVADVEQLCGHIRQPYDAVVLLRATTALRPQELRPLRIADVDTDEWLLWVQRTETPVPSQYHHEGKRLAEGGVKARDPGYGRWVPILHPRMRVWVAQRIADADSDQEPLCRGPRGGPIDMDRVRGRHFNPAVAAQWAGTSLEGLTFYELRHTAIAFWISLGVRPEVAASWAGHSIETMQRHYQRMARDADQATRERIHRQLAGEIPHPTTGIPDTTDTDDHAH